MCVFFKLEFGGVVDHFIFFFNKTLPLGEKISTSGQWQAVLMSFCELGQQKYRLFRKYFQVMISRSHPTYRYVRIFFLRSIRSRFCLYAAFKDSKGSLTMSDSSKIQRNVNHSVILPFLIASQLHWSKYSKGGVVLNGTEREMSIIPWVEKSQTIIRQELRLMTGYAGLNIRVTWKAI